MAREVPYMEWRLQDCAECRELDDQFGTSSDSLLHHDAKCPVHNADAARLWKPYPRHLVVTGTEPDQQDPTFTEITLTADRDHTLLVWEERGMPLEWVAAYGAGVQIHVEDLIAHLAGQERCEAAARWIELQPACQVPAASVG